MRAVDTGSSAEQALLIAQSGAEARRARSHAGVELHARDPGKKVCAADFAGAEANPSMRPDIEICRNAVTIARIDGRLVNRGLDSGKAPAAKPEIIAAGDPEAQICRAIEGFGASQGLDVAVARSMGRQRKEGKEQGGASRIWRISFVPLPLAFRPDVATRHHIEYTRSGVKIRQMPRGQVALMGVAPTGPPRHGQESK